MGITAAVLLAQCAWDSGPSPCSPFLPVFVHPVSKCHAKVIVWAASVWSIKTGVMLEGPFTGPCQCTNECEVLSRLLCMTNTDTAKTAKCKLLWVVWAWDLNCKGQKSTSRNQHFLGWQGLQKAFSAVAISKPVQLWGQPKAFKALPWKIEISRKYVQIHVQKISKVPSPFRQPAPMLDCPHDGKGSPHVQSEGFILVCNPVPSLWGTCHHCLENFLMFMGFTCLRGLFPVVCSWMTTCVLFNFR